MPVLFAPLACKVEWNVRTQSDEPKNAGYVAVWINSLPTSVRK